MSEKRSNCYPSISQKRIKNYFKTKHRLQKRDKIVLTKLTVPPLKEELKSLSTEIDKQNKGKEISDREILEAHRISRLEKQAKKTRRITRGSFIRYNSKIVITNAQFVFVLMHISWWSTGMFLNLNAINIDLKAKDTLINQNIEG